MRYLLILLLLWVNNASFAQQDSLKIYRQLKKIAARHHLTKMAYEAVFRDPDPKDYPKEPAGKVNKNVNPFLKVKGKVIGSVNITVLDPFGYSLSDSIGSAKGFRAWGNRIHVRTHRTIVANRLLLKAGDKVDPLKFSESERLLRQAVFINDARISVKLVHDTVLVSVLVIDKWPVTLPAELTDINANAQFRNNNLFGTGQQFEQYAKVNRDLSYVVKAFYNVSNFGRTYISSRVGYEYRKTGTNAYISFDKPFYSFLASWAGGIYFYHNWQKFTYYDAYAGINKTKPLNSLGYDAWVGKNIKLGNKRTLLGQSSNLVLAARYFDNQFLNRPPALLDPGRSFPRRQAALFSTGIAVQQYYKDKFIYRFGANEDVPEGLMMQGTVGVIWKEYQKMRYYTGFEIGRSRHFSIGYFSSSVGYGIFFNQNVPNDVTISYSLQYFSNLIKAGRWYIRQFCYYNILHGENKFENQSLSLRSEDLYGFPGGVVSGTTRMVLNSETVAYMPYVLAGFRFAPVLMAGLGVTGSTIQPVQQSKIYQAYSFGLMMRNENLLVSTFQVSVGFYPYLPDRSRPLFIYNPVTSFTLRVRTFSVGHPDFISY